MKKILSIIAFVGILYVSQAQTVVPFGQRVPEYYYWDTNWYDKFVIMNPDSVFDVYPYQRYYNFPGENQYAFLFARYFWTDVPLKIIGVAAPVLCNDSTHSLYGTSVRTDEYFSVYKATDTGYVLLEEAVWEDTVRYSMCLRHKDGTDTIEVREAYFKKGIIVTDSFYVGGTSWNSGMRWSYFDAEMPGQFYYTTPPTNYLSFLPYPNYLSDNYWAYSTPVMMRYLRSCLYTNMPESFGTYDTISWIHINHNPFFLAIFPIFDTSYVYEPPLDTCPQPTGLHILNQDSTSITLAWDDNGTGSWEFSYGTTADAENGTIIPCSVNFITLSDLDTATQYVAYVRSVCSDTLPSLWSDSLHIFIPGDTASGGHGEPEKIISNIDLFTYLMPNPAHSQVLVSSSYGLQSIQIFTIGGVLLEQHSANGISTTLDVANLSKGIYIVRIVTPSGSAVKRLIVN